MKGNEDFAQQWIWANMTFIGCSFTLKINRTEVYGHFALNQALVLALGLWSLLSSIESDFDMVLKVNWLINCLTTALFAMR